ncbi:MAG: hypothetical protein K8R92_01875 [Planctomycetes bacterium]|nr:hypothetical protein [Planctomycetota bacterium]
MKNPMSCRALVLFVVGLTALTVFTPAAWARPKVPRNILKTYFETGDKPSSAQFAVLIDSSVFQFQITSGVGGAHTIEGLEPGNGILMDTSGIKRFGIGDTIPTDSLYAQAVNLSAFTLDDRYLIGMRFMQNNQAHFGYMDVSVDSPLPGQDGHFGLTIHYWAYEDLPNTPITVVPAPGVLSGALAGAGLMRRRRKV